MSSRREPGPGQEVFQEIDTASRPQINLDARRAFGGAIKLEYWAIDEEMLPETGPEDFQRVSIPNLQRGLYTYRAPRSIRGVAFSPIEWMSLIRSPKDFGEAVVAKTIAARELDYNFERREGKIARSGTHAFEQKLESMETLLEGLQSELGYLYRMAERIHSVGYAHESDASMRTLMEFIRSYPLANMLNVVARQQKWDEGEKQRAEAALTRKLFTGPQSQRVKHWNQMVKLATRYDEDKIKITKQKIDKSRQQMENMA